MRNDKIVLIGGGGHCKSVLDAVLRSRNYSEIVITDNDLPVGTSILGCKVVGNDDLLPDLYRNGVTFGFISIGSIKSTDVRHRAYERAYGVGFEFPIIADPSAIIASSAAIGKGVFIGKNAVVNADAVIGHMAIINTGAIIEHGCKIGEFSHIAVGAVACGNVTIKKGVFMGARSVVTQGVSIGEGVMIGAGSIVLKSVPSYQKIYGIYKGERNEES